jgi:hypothetical protein
LETGEEFGTPFWEIGAGLPGVSVSVYKVKKRGEPRKNEEDE